MSPERTESINQVFEQLVPVFQERLKGKKLIAFDFDGTLTSRDNPEFDEAIQTALVVGGYEYLSEHGQAVEIEELKEEIRQRYLRGESITNFFQQVLAIPREYTVTVVNSVEKWRYLDEDPKLMPMLRELKEKGYRLALASNSPRQENLLALERLGIEVDIFDLMLSMDDVGHSKPHRDTFDQVLIKSGLPVEACIFVGDSLTKDIRGAKGIGMDGILVGEIADEATAWLPDIYALPRLFIRYQIAFVKGESGCQYPYIKDAQRGEIVNLKGGNELFLEPSEVERLVDLLNSGISPKKLGLE